MLRISTNIGIIFLFVSQDCIIDEGCCCCECLRTIYPIRRIYVIFSLSTLHPGKRFLCWSCLRASMRKSVLLVPSCLNQGYRKGMYILIMFQMATLPFWYMGFLLFTITGNTKSAQWVMLSIKRMFMLSLYVEMHPCCTEVVPMLAMVFSSGLVYSSFFL